MISRGKKFAAGIVFVNDSPFLFQQPINMYDYRSVVTFGGWNEDLMIVVNQLIESAPHHYEHRTDKLLFLLPKHKVGQSVTRNYIHTVYF